MVLQTKLAHTTYHLKPFCFFAGCLFKVCCFIISQWTFSYFMHIMLTVCTMFQNVLATAQTCRKFHTELTKRWPKLWCRVTECRMMAGKISRYNYGEVCCKQSLTMPLETILLFLLGVCSKSVVLLSTNLP